MSQFPLKPKFRWKKCQLFWHFEVKTSFHWARSVHLMEWGKVSFLRTIWSLLPLVKRNSPFLPFCLNSFSFSAACSSHSSSDVTWRRSSIANKTTQLSFGTSLNNFLSIATWAACTKAKDELLCWENQFSNRVNRSSSHRLAFTSDLLFIPLSICFVPCKPTGMLGTREQVIKHERDEEEPLASAQRASHWPSPKKKTQILLLRSIDFSVAFYSRRFN